MRGILVLILAFLSYAAAQRDQKDAYPTYPSRYDHLNVDDVLRNNRLLKSYYRCIVGQGTCTAEGSELKRILPDALRTRCSKCSPAQKKNSRKVLEYIMKYKPEMWEGIKKKFDPDGTLTKDILTDPNFLG